GSAVKLGLGGGNLQVAKNAAALVSVTAPSAGAWHHVAYTWDGTTNTLYVDGTATPSTTAHDSGAVTGAIIGAASASTELFAGQVDDLRVYDTALSARQVGQLVLGRYAGTGGLSTVTLGANVSIAAAARGMTVDSGNV